jgi:hypothetical protein
MGMLVADGAVVPLAVGGGKPGVEVKPDGVLPASSVRAEAVYSPFKVANVSGVARFAEMLQASWVMMIKTTNRVAGDFFVDMISSGNWFSKD